MRGIDISSHQTGLDLSRLPGSGYDFAILRITYGATLEDQTAPGFYMRAREAGVPVGGYCYCYAQTPEQARAAAETAARYLMGFPLPLGLFVDIEEPEQLALSHDALLAMVLAFCDRVREAGYTPGVYGSEGTLWAKLRPEELPDDVLIWVAHYGKEPAMPCDLWQSSDRGVFPGYAGPVDVNEVQSDRFQRLVFEESGGDDTATIEALCGIIAEQAEIIKNQAAELERLRSLTNKLEGKI